MPEGPLDRPVHEVAIEEGADMADEVLELVEDLGRVIRGEAPRYDRWKDPKERAENPMTWNRRASSNNIPRLCRAIGVYEQPDVDAPWWTEVLSLEIEGIVKDGLDWFWRTGEPWSGTYEGWSYLSEAAAYERLRGSSNDAHRQAAEVLRKDLRRTAGMLALVAIPELILRGGRDQVTYRGLGLPSLAARTLANHQLGRASQELLARALAVPPAVEKQPSDAARAADGLPATAWGLDDADRATLLALIRENDRDAARRTVEELIAGAKTAVGVEIRRWPDRVASWFDENPHSQTGCTFGGTTPRRGAVEPTQPRFAFPYPEDGKIRGGNPLLGRGRGWLDGHRYRCLNLTDAEYEARKAEHPDVRQIESGFDLATGPPELVLRCDRDTPLHLA